MIDLEGKELLDLDSSQRRNFLNLISGVKSAHLIGTLNNEGVSNLGIFNSVVHVGANPPLLGFVQRPLTVERQTYTNIKNHGVFTLNAISSAIVDAAHQCSAKYDDGVSEFSKTGLTEKYIEGFAAPFVQESPIQIGLRFIEENPIKANGCIFVIGQIEFLHISIPKLEGEGFFTLDELDIVGIGGLDSYYNLNLIERKAFARP